MDVESSDVKTQLKAFGYDEQEINDALNAVLNPKDINSVLDQINHRNKNNKKYQHEENKKNDLMDNNNNKPINKYKVCHQLITMGYTEKQINSAMKICTNCNDIESVIEAIHIYNVCII